MAAAAHSIMLQKWTAGMLGKRFLPGGAPAGIRGAFDRDIPGLHVIGSGRWMYLLRGFLPVLVFFADSTAPHFQKEPQHGYR